MIHDDHPFAKLSDSEQTCGLRSSCCFMHNAYKRRDGRGILAVHCETDVEKQVSHTIDEHIEDII